MARADINDWLTDEGLILIEGWARDGLTNEQIAENIGVSRTTLYNWKNKDVNIMNALKQGKEVVDRHVENALFKNAMGFGYEEQTTTNDGRVVTVKKYSKPNVTAQIFWLKNRKPTVWRDKTEQDISHSGLNITIGDYDDDD